MKAKGYRGKAFAALWILSALTAAGEERMGPKMSTSMPTCAELENGSASQLVGYLERDRKGLSASCVEFAIRQLESAADQMPVADSERALGALMPFLDFRSTNTGNTKFYPAKNTIVATTDSVTQRLREAGEDSGPAQQRVLDKLVGMIADTAVSGIVADNAAWAVEQILAYPKASAGALPAVTMLVRAAKASADASSSKRFWDEARKLAATCAGGVLQSQCDAALN